MNWGKGLAISMTIFIIFIVGLGIFMVRDSVNLYESDYYQKGEDHTALMAEEKTGSLVEMSYQKEVLLIDLKQKGRIDEVVFKHMGNSAHDRVQRSKDGTNKQVYRLAVTTLQPGIWHAEVRGSFGDNLFRKRIKFVVP